MSTRLYTKYKVQCTILNMDLTDPGSPQKIAEEMERRGIQVDLLVNNAGFSLSGNFFPMTPGRSRLKLR